MSDVQRFYDERALYEWQRLERHIMEFALNIRCLDEYLPRPPAKVADIGGGPGRYAIHLTRLGHQVTLLDLAANNLAFARIKAAEAGVTLTGVEQGNALDLRRLATESFDAVLLMGPMYHLLQEAERKQALREAHRILKPGGIMAVSFINRYATIRTHDPDWVVRNAQEVRSELDTGCRWDRTGHFTDSYAAHPTEVRALLEQNGFTYIDMIASEGIKSEIETPIHLVGEELQTWFDISYRMAKDPTLHGAAVHLLAVVRKGESAPGDAPGVGEPT